MSEHYSTKELPYSDRPYEKLEKYGASYLSNSELFAIIFRTGTRDENSIDLARRLLQLGEGESDFYNLYQLSLKDLQQVKGIGRVKAIQTKAVLELSKRVSQTKYNRSKSIVSPNDVAQFYMEEMRYLQKEIFKIVLLDTKCKVIQDVVVSMGSLNSSIVHPREVFIEAVKFSAASVILMHNHPSGDPTPSKEDINITKRLIEGGTIMGISVVDHIIFGNGRYISLKEKGLI